MRSKDFLNRYQLKERLVLENQYVGSSEGFMRRGETRFQVNIEGADTLNSVQPQGKLKHQAAWQAIGSAIVGNAPDASTAVDVKNFDLIRFKVLILDPASQTDQAQTLTPDVAPTNGTFKIRIGSLTTAAIAYNATATNIRDAIRLLSGYANVTVTGTLASTVVITFVGIITVLALVEIIDSTLNVPQTNEVQTLTPDTPPDSGTYKITIGALSTTDLAWNASAAAIQAAIRALAGFDGVTVSGTLATAVVITFAGETTDTAEITITDNVLLIVATPVVINVVTSPAFVAIDNISIVVTISTALVEGSEVNFIASGFWD